MKGIVSKLETFGLVDGPGVRCVVFMQGCAMRCRYCHNPETWDMAGTKEFPVTEYESKELADKLMRYKTYWRNNGGVTVSGGEPLLQIDFVNELFSYLKQKNVHTAVDTAGQCFSDDEQWQKKFEKLMSVTDLFILDIKEYDREKHKELTGVYNDNILKMAKMLSDNGKTMWIRHVLVPNLTDDPQSLADIKSFIDSLKTVEKTEILPYHSLGTVKWEKLGIPYSLDGVKAPTEEEVKKAESILLG